MAYGAGYAGGYGDLPAGFSVTVEVAFSTDPGATPTWTDVSTYLERFSVHRGRADELAAFSAGQATITLANEDRRFDPVYAAGPYYPNVVPMRRIRIRATYNSITYDVYNGYVTNWRQEYSPPQAAECVVEASDAFKVLANIDLPSSAYAAEVLADNPVSWWRFDETAGTVAYDAMGRLDLAAYGTPTVGTTTLISRDGGASMTTVATTDGFYADGAFPVTGGPLTIEVVAKVTTESGTIIAGAASKAVGSGFDLASDESIGFEVATSPGVAAAAASTVDYTDGLTHHIVGVWGADNTLKIYVDGVDRTSGAPTLTIGTFSPNSGTVFVGGNPIIAGSIGVYDEVAIYNTGLSAARVLAHYQAINTPWNSDLSGARVGRILNAAGWPAADRSIDTGVAVLQSSDLATTALSALQKVEETEQGALFVTAAGAVRFIARDNLLKAPYATSQATFGDSGSELEYGDLTYQYDDSLIYNEVTVSRTEGTAVTVKDATSQTRYLRRTRTIDGLLHQSDTTSIDLANYVLGHYKDPVLRVTGMRLEPSAANESTHFPQALGRELMDRVTVLRRPQNLGAAISQDSQIQGITHTVTPVEWVTTWDLSPAESQVYWILGTAGFSELDQTTRLGF